MDKIIFIFKADGSALSDTKSSPISTNNYARIVLVCLGSPGAAGMGMDIYAAKRQEARVKSRPLTSGKMLCWCLSLVASPGDTGEQKSLVFSCW